MGRDLLKPTQNTFAKEIHALIYLSPLPDFFSWCKRFPLFPSLNGGRSEIFIAKCEHSHILITCVELVHFIWTCTNYTNFILNFKINLDVPVIQNILILPYYGFIYLDKNT